MRIHEWHPALHQWRSLAELYITSLVTATRRNGFLHRRVGVIQDVQRHACHLTAAKRVARDDQRFAGDVGNADR